MTKTAALLCLALACAATARAEDEAPAGKYFVLLGTTLLEPDDKRNPQLDGAIGAELRFGRGRASGWGYELRAFYEQLEETQPEDTGNRSGFGVDALYRFPQFLSVTIYGAAGGGFVYSDALPGKDWIAPLLNVAVGLESAPLFRLMGGWVRARVEGRYHYEDNRDEYYAPSSFDPSNYAETRAYAGLSWSLPPPPPPPGPVEVVPPEAAPEAQPPAEPQ